MGRHGENIRKRTDGRWEARLKVFDENSGRIIYKSVYAGSYDEVKAKRLEAEKKVQRSQPGYVSTNNPAMPDELLFSVVAEGWLCTLEHGKKSTYVKYSQVYKNHIAPHLSDVRMKDFSDDIVHEKSLIYTIVNEKQLSSSILNSIYSVLNGALRYASEIYGINTPHIKSYPIKTVSSQVTAFDRIDQIRLFQILYENMDIYKLAVLLCLNTGIRLGELCALRWDDIDLEHKILSVNRTVQRLYVNGNEAKTALVISSPKSGHSLRQIPLSDEMAMRLSSFWDGQEYVFGCSKPLEPRTMQNHFKKILKEAGISDTNFHVLRHTFATVCVESGVDVKALSEMLGHSDVSITLNRYVHITMDTKRKYMQRLGEFYGQIYGEVS